MLAPIVVASRGAAPELELRAIVEPATHAGIVETPKPSLRREGDVWSIEWAGRGVRLRDGRGPSLLARLVESPRQELHVLELTSTLTEPRDTGDAGLALDSKPLQSRRRLLGLRDELSEAETFADAGRAEKARTEMDFLSRELARAVAERRHDTARAAPSASRVTTESSRPFWSMTILLAREAVCSRAVWLARIRSAFALQRYAQRQCAKD